MAMTRQFPLEVGALRKRFAEYRQRVEDDKAYIPDWAHFLSTFGSYPEEAQEVLIEPKDKNIPLAAELKREIGWFIGQYSVHPAWRGQGTTKSIWLQKQLGYTDRQEIKSDTKTAINITFNGAGSDPFA